MRQDVLHDRIVGIDTEYAPDGALLTIAIATAQYARVWDVGDGLGTA